MADFTLLNLQIWFSCKTVKGVKRIVSIKLNYTLPSILFKDLLLVL